MSKTTELVERLRELPRDTRKATVEIYDLCIEASYKIEELTDRCARYASDGRKQRDGRMWSAGADGDSLGKARGMDTKRHVKQCTGAGLREVEWFDR